MAVARSTDLAPVPDELTEVGKESLLSLKYLSNNVLAADKVL